MRMPAILTLYAHLPIDAKILTTGITNYAEKKNNLAGISTKLRHRGLVRLKLIV